MGLVVFGYQASSVVAGSEEAPSPAWGVAEGFVVERDAGGFVLPTALAFVPEPGGGSNDPLYFVTELRGTIRVVSNDRSISEFADLSTFAPPQEYPDLSGEGGLAGICLDPDNGYVFVTYTYREENGTLRNGMTRFETMPGTFAGGFVGSLNLDHIFVNEITALSHQIGPCHVSGDSVFVSVGDGANPTASRDPERLLGKMVRMTLDGLPHPENPLYSQGGDAAFSWAWGLRNPFSLDVVDGKVYVADNGPAVDRFLLVEPGNDYLWDGTDWSIGATAKSVFSPAIGPVQMERYPAGLSLFPEEYQNSFFVALSEGGAAGVIHIPYDPVADVSSGVSAYVVRGRADYRQAATGLAFGPDALYFTSILPDATGTSDVVRLRYDPDAGYDHGLFGGEAEALIGKYGCASCHRIDGVGGTVGSALDTNSLDIRVRTRLDSPEYQELVRSLNELNEEPFSSWRDERAAVLQAEGRSRLALWISYKLQEPRFDNPDAQMPQLGITEAEANIIAADLLDVADIQPWYRRILASVFGNRRNLIAFAAGGGAGFVVGILATLLVRRWRRKAKPAPSA